MSKACSNRMEIRLLCIAAIVGLVLAGAIGTAGAQPTVRELFEKATQGTSEVTVEATPPPAPAPVAAPPVAAGPADDLGRGTPRGAMAGFLAAAGAGDYVRAAEYLDLSHVRPADREAVGTQLARHLRVVLDQNVWIDLEALSPDPAGRSDDGLSPSRDRVVKIAADDGTNLDVQLARVVRDGVPLWMVSRRTLDDVPDVYENLGYGILGEYLPSGFLEYEVGGRRVWQGAVLLALLVASYLIGWLASRIFGTLLGLAWRRRGRRAASFLVGPLHLAIAASVFSGASAFLPLALITRVILGGLETALLIAAFTWVVLRGIDLAFRVWAERLARRGKSDALPLLSPARRTGKILAVAIAILAILASFGFDVTAALAGLGVGGIAIALAAQKSIENLFGGVSLYADQPVRVGDFCRFGDRSGTVEEIGLRSTRVRTLERSVLTIPNAEFAQLQIENLSRRDRFWFNPTIGLRYETTPDQIRYVLVEIRKILYAHPEVDNEPARVRFKAFGAYSLDLEVFAYVLAASYDQYLEVAEDLNLRIMEVVERAGSGFAFPSQTTYVESGSGLDRDAGRAAEQEVARWREQGELPLPRFTPRAIDGLRGTLRYPADGSAVSRDEIQQGRAGGAHE